MSKKAAETPMMKQFYEIKGQHPDAILLFRVGDFYETFAEDAKDAAEILGITLTRRANGAASFVALAGFPHHALDTYLPKLVRAGRRVAICDQLEDPKQTKNLVKRGITEIVTPGVSIDDNILNHKENNYLCCIHFDRKMLGVSFLDISTGEFVVAEGSKEYIDKLLTNFAPKEILIERGKKRQFVDEFDSRYFTFELEDWYFTESTAKERLLKQFETETLNGFGIDDLSYGLIAAGTALHYLDNTHHTEIGHITAISRIEEEKYVRLDKFTIRSLELVSTMNEGGKTLLNILDKTSSPMGARMLRKWLVFPLRDKKAIENRHSVIDYLFKDLHTKEVLEKQLPLIGDLERIISKVAVNRISPREIVQLKVALLAIEPITESFANASESKLQDIGKNLDLCISIRDRIEKEILPDPPIAINRGSVIKNGINEELDSLRDIKAHGKEYLMKIQKRESDATGISSLKIGFNNVFGYYIEVRNTHKDKVPEEWVRKQTLVSAERYITEELKEYEEKILGAEEKIQTLENALFNDLVESLIPYIPKIQKNANLIAQIDCLDSFAKVAQEYKYIRPEINDGDILSITKGRHPVIEQQLPIGQSYVENDVLLDPKEQQIIMITGPNMSGKSALLRQTALITLMAQAGSFVPAEAAQIGLVDKIFTRVGASDNISQGESTFMVEMNEASNILNNISSKSLVLFDELGRGTSTYDGISIAWAIVEYIHEHATAQAKTLFATHYHELNEMEKSFNRIKNYNVSVKEIDNKIIFLRKLKRGGSEHSFGIHVAKMAGMPQSIVKRANTILKQLESNTSDGMGRPAIEEMNESREGYQLNFFQLDDPVLTQVRNEILSLDVNNLTPMDALNKLNDIKKIVSGK